VTHDVKEYPDAGHTFLNNHDSALFAVMGKVIGGGYHEPSAQDARRRIVSFFDEHLKERRSTGSWTAAAGVRFRIEGRASGEPHGGLPCIVFFIGALLIVAAEIAAFVLVAERVGFLWALLILIVVSGFGPFVVRRVGSGVLAHTRERLALGEVPTRELLDGLVVLIGGVMICVPGFIGDAVGLLLMIGPVRHLVIRAFGHQMARKVQKMPPGRWGFIDARSMSVRNEGAARNDISLPPGTPDRPVEPGDAAG
jgi:UPF0716 family protein affecting phage T7 exclusion